MVNFYKVTGFDGFFTGMPDRIWSVSAVFTVLFLVALAAKARFRQIRCIPLLVVSLLWLANGFYERSLLAHRQLADGTVIYRRQYNIRVDLLLFDPVIFFTTATCLALVAHSVFRAIKARPPASPAVTL